MDNSSFRLKSKAITYTYVVGVVEGVGIISVVPFSPVIVIFAGLLAFFVVESRIYLAEGSSIAQLKGDESLFNRLNMLMHFTALLTVIAFMQLGSEWLERSKSDTIANSLEYQVMGQRVESATQQLADLEENNPYSMEEITSARGQQTALRSEIERLEAKARAEQQRDLRSIQDKIEAFWSQTAYNSNGKSTGCTVREMAKTCPGGSSFYQKRYCPQLAALQSGAPLAFPPEVEENKRVLNSLSGVIAYEAQIEHAKNTLASAKQELLGWLENVENKMEVYPAPLYRFADLIGAEVSLIPNITAAIFIALALFFSYLPRSLIQAAMLVAQDNQSFPVRVGLTSRILSWLKERWNANKQRTEHTDSTEKRTPVHTGVQPYTVTYNFDTPLTANGVSDVQSYTTVQPTYAYTKNPVELVEKTYVCTKNLVDDLPAKHPVRGRTENMDDVNVSAQEIYELNQLVTTRNIHTYQQLIRCIEAGVITKLSFSYLRDVLHMGTNTDIERYREQLVEDGYAIKEDNGQLRINPRKVKVKK